MTSKDQAGLVLPCISYIGLLQCHDGPSGARFLWSDLCGRGIEVTIAGVSAVVLTVSAAIVLNALVVVVD